MYGEASSSRPRKNNSVDDLDPEVARFLSGVQEEEFPQSPVDDERTIIFQGGSDDEHSSGKDKEPVRNKGKELDRGDVIAKDQDPTSGFFRLPYDVRQLVYQNLLQSDEPIAAGTGGAYDGEYEPNAQGHDLHPQLLETCRQIHSECGDMLFKDNIFQLTINELHQYHQVDGRCNPYLSQMERERSRQLQYLKRVKIVIDQTFDPRQVEVAIQTTARVLTQQLSRLTHLSIEVEQDEEDPEFFSNDNGRYGLLRGLTIIRNIQNVTVEGVDPDYAEFLTEKLTTASSLSKMYYDLEFFARGIDCVEHELENAYEAAIRGEFGTFVSSRAWIIRAVKEHMRHAELHLFDNDPVQMPEATEPPTTEKCSAVSGCGHCLPPRPQPEDE